MPIPLSEIASQAESTKKSIRDIEASLSTDQITTSVEKGLPHLAAEIDLRTAESAKLLAVSLPLELLQRLRLVFQNFGDDLSKWNHDLTEHAKSLDNQIVLLDRLSKIWRSTLQLQETSQMPPEILKRVQSLIDSIGRTRQAVESRRAKVLNLLSRVLESTDRVQTASSSVEQAQTKAVKSLFVPDSPPLWSREVRNWAAEGGASLYWQASVSVFSAYIKGQPALFLLKPRGEAAEAQKRLWCGRDPLGFVQNPDKSEVGQLFEPENSVKDLYR